LKWEDHRALADQTAPWIIYYLACFLLLSAAAAIGGGLWLGAHYVIRTMAQVREDA
jgi:hypothetical protein